MIKIKLYYIIFIIISIFIFFVSCKNEESEKTKKAITTLSINPLNASELKLSDIFEDVNYIKLDNKNYIEEIENLQVIGEKIFINDGKKIHIYNIDGTFIRSIGNLGKGPDEYLTLKNFNVDLKKSSIKILDINGKKLIDYTFQGESLKNRKIDFYAYDFIESENRIYFYSGYEINETTNFSLNILDKNFKTKAHKFSVNKNMSLYYYLRQERYFYTKNDSLFLFRDPFNTIYYVSGNKIEPYIILDFGKYNMPVKFISSKYEDIFTFGDKADKNSYVHHVNHFIENDKLIYFTFRYKGNINEVFHLKKKEKTYVVNKMINDMGLNNLQTPSGYNNIPRTYDKNTLYYAIESFYFIEQLNKIKSNLDKVQWDKFLDNNENISEIYKNLEINDNPIIVAYKIK